MKRYWANVNQDDSQEVVAENVSAEEILQKIWSFRNIAGNAYRPITIVDEEGHIVMDEDRHKILEGGMIPKILRVD